MKRLYQEKKWKDYSQKVSNRVLKKKQSHKKFEKNQETNTKKIPRYRHIKKGKNRVKITAPPIFSIVNNTEEMLRFFIETKKYVSQKMLINFDMSGIKQMTADGILYMLSLFDYWEKCYGVLNVSGNIPCDETCKMLLIDSGFFNYVRSTIKHNQSNTHILSIESDSLADGLIAQKVIDFTYNHLGKEKTNESKSIYAMLIECMGNTKQHAYREGDPLPRWWLIALYDKNINKVSFAFVDNGSGIPGTVKKKFGEVIKQIMDNIFGTTKKVEDNILLTSALNGEFRTKTQKGYRGNGLPKILSYSKKKIIDNLIIISNNGYVNCSTSDSKELIGKFNGTLLSWDFVS